jgi:hypothetical protein
MRTVVWTIPQIHVVSHLSLVTVSSLAPKTRISKRSVHQAGKLREYCKMAYRSLQWVACYNRPVYRHFRVSSATILQNRRGGRIPRDKVDWSKAGRENKRGGSKEKGKQCTTFNVFCISLSTFPQNCSFQVQVAFGIVLHFSLLLLFATSCLSFIQSSYSSIFSSQFNL